MDGGSSENGKLALFRKIVEDTSQPIDREEVSKLFTDAARKFPNGACSLLMRVIEKLLKRKISPVEEISALFAFVTGSRANANLLEVLTTKLPLQYTKLEYFLRIYTLRTLINDKELSIKADVLRSIAGDRDAGRIAVIDFILTRRNTNGGLFSLLSGLLTQLDDSKSFAVDSKRNKAIARLSLKFPKDCGDLEMSSITSHKAVLAEWDRLTQCSAAEIRQWLDILRQKAREGQNGDSWRRAISSSLINLGTAFKNDPVVIEMWSLAIELEDTLPTPSAQIQQKLWRLCLALKVHINGSVKAITTGLKLTFKHLGVLPTAETLNNENLETLANITGALVQLPNWDELVDSIFVDADKNYQLLLSWFLVIVASNVPLGRSYQEPINRLMSVTSACSIHTRLELEQAYFSMFKTGFDLSFLQLVATTNEDPHQSNVALALIAKSLDSRKDSLGAYRTCLKITSTSDPLVCTVLKELGFIDVARKVGVQPAEIEPVPLYALNGRIKQAKSQGKTLEFIDLLVTAWLMLSNSGCYQDAARYLSAAKHSAELVFGPHNIRHLSILRLYDEFATQVGLDSLPNASGNETQTLPEELRQAVDQLSNCWLAHYPQALSHFDATYEQVTKRLAKDAVGSLLWESAISLPSFIKSSAREAHNDMETCFKNAFSAAEALQGLNWAQKMKVANRLHTLKFICSNMNASPDLEHEAGIMSTPSLLKIQGEPIQASRAFYTESDDDLALGELPGSIVCLSLNFDEEGVLCITRLEKGSDPISIRLPPERAAELRDEDLSEDDIHSGNSDGNAAMRHEDAVEKIAKIIEQSTQVPTTNAKLFWEQQRMLDSELKSLIEKLQRTWIGGFSGVINAPAGLLKRKVASETLEQLEMIFVSTIKYQRKRNPQNWSLNPIVVPLLQDAVERKNSGELNDLVLAVLDAMRFHGLPVAHDEIDTWNLVREIKHVFRSSGNLVDNTGNQKPKRVLLICDRRAAQIPWEIFPVFKDVDSVTRSLSLQQAAEWAKLPQPIAPEATYLINPDQDLPPTHKVFIQNFSQRGWEGLAGVKPTEAEFAAQLQKCQNFVYVGHGSGKNYIRGSSIRKLYATASAVFLLGCNSVRIRNLILDDDALTEYSVMGSKLIMGTLWAVKDKEFNRFSHEFLSRVFDERESVGEALRQARGACVLPHLTGGAPVVYGLP